MPPSELLVMPSFDFLAKLEHRRLLSDKGWMNIWLEHISKSQEEEQLIMQ